MGGFITTTVFDIIIILEIKVCSSKKVSSRRGMKTKLAIIYDKNKISKC
jgi:hypothetical protein